MKSFLFLSIFFLSVYGCNPKIPAPTQLKTEIKTKPDTVFVFSTDTVFVQKYIPTIEIPHPEHGRIIVDLNDTTVLLTRSHVKVVNFKSAEQINDFLYQEFDGHLYNRK